MSPLSITRETLDRLFAEEGLDPPGILPWPLAGAAEEDRLERERRFLEGAGSKPPAGLEWMASHTASKYRPDRVLEGCRAVLVTSLGYFREDAIDGSGADPREGGGPDGPRLPEGRIARYARGRDYHKELGGRLRRVARRLGELSPGDAFRSFVDIGPLDETWLAEASGVGFRGRHGLIIIPEAGSWVFLGHIVTTHDFASEPEADSPSRRSAPLACPDGCRRCIEACPTDALAMPGVIDASRCVSNLTIERKGVIPEELREGVGDRVFGCDACQEVCLFNARSVPADTAAFAKDIAGPSASLAELLAIRNHGEMTDRFAGSSLMRAGRNGLVRNACTAAGNLVPVGRPSGEMDGDDVPAGARSSAPGADYSPEIAGIARLLENLVEDEDEGVRGHARWALERLKKYPGADSNG